MGAVATRADLDALYSRAETAASAEERATCLRDIGAALEGVEQPGERARLLMCRTRVRSNQWHTREVLQDALVAMALFEEAGEPGRALEAASLGAGFASISLRNFSKTRLRNPYPPRHFWAALSNIANTPAESVEVGHLVLLKNMVEGSWERIILFWGNVGVAALREGCVHWPARLPPALRVSPAGRGLGLMVEGWEKDKEFRLT